MLGKERRVSPRRDCMIPIRFRILPNVNADVYADVHVGVNSTVSGTIVASQDDSPRLNARHLGMLDGEAVNLSERGIGFKSREKLGVGDEIDVHLTIPQSLSGRISEKVCCKARVVHVDRQIDVRGLSGFGAVVDRFEAVALVHGWVS